MSRYRIIENSHSDWATWNIHKDLKYYTLEKKVTSFSGVLNYIFSGLKGDAKTWQTVEKFEFSTYQEAKEAVKMLRTGNKVEAYKNAKAKK